MKKASVNWPAPDYSCPKPRAKFPAVTLGGLPPPTFAKRSLTPVVLPSGSPCQPPPPRPLPLSLRPQEPAPAKVGFSTAPVVTSSQQRSLVLPTSLPLISVESLGERLQHLCSIGILPNRSMNVGWGNSFAPLAHHLGFAVNFLSRKHFLQ